MAMRFGIQLYPPCAAPQMAAYAAKAMAQHRFAKVWVPDHLTYENVFIILAAIIGRTDAHVGTSVIHPFSRTPVDLASSFAALSNWPANAASPSASAPARPHRT